MNKKSRILIVGRKKYISDNLQKVLIKKGYKNLISNFDFDLNLDLLKNIDSFFIKQKPEYIFYLGGNYGGIKNNIEEPSTLMVDNMFLNTHILFLSDKYNVKKLLYLSSSCVYPNDIIRPLMPSDLMTKKLEKTSQSYAMANLAGIELCRAYSIENNRKFIPVIPSTIYGPGKIFLSNNNSHVLIDLIKKIYNAKITDNDKITLWGTGKPMRDFIYLDDLSNALIFLMEKYNQNIPINIGNNEYFSIHQISKIIKKSLNYSGKICFDNKSADGNLKKLLNSKPIKKIGWNHQVSTIEGIVKSCDWYKKYLKNNSYKIN